MCHEHKDGSPTLVQNRTITLYYVDMALETEGLALRVPSESVLHRY